MQRFLTVLLIILCTQLHAQQDAGFYFMLNPNNPLKYYVSTQEEIHQYPDGSQYEDSYYSYEIKEWRPMFSMGFDLGYQATNGLIAGANIRVLSDMLDIQPELNVSGTVGYKFSVPIALHSRVGMFGSNRSISYSLGGIMDFYFPMNSDRFDFGFRTGYTFSPLYKNRENVNDWGGGEIYINRYSMTYHIVEIGLFLKWH